MTDDRLTPPVLRGREAVGWLRRLRTDPLPVFDELRATFGTHVLFVVGRKRFLVTFDAYDVEFVLIPAGARMMKGRALQRSRSLFGNGLLVSEGDVHKRQRRLAQPAFQPRRLAPYAAPMVRHTVAALDQLTTGAPVDLERVMSRLTLDIAAETMFGTQLDEREARELGHAMDVVRDQFNQSLHPLAPLYELLPLPSTLRGRRAVRTIQAVVARIVRERHADPDAAARTDLLSLLVRAKDAEGDGLGMSDELLRDECVTLLLAGHETTANALAWALWLLATHPEQLARVRAEIRDRCGDELPTVEDVGNLPYLRRVIAETLRMYPPGPALTRRALEAVTLPSGVEVPAGCELLVPIATMHRDPRWFPEPATFDPDRFATGTPPSEWPRHVWVPFGGGRRVCIGQAFAMMEMELVLAVVVTRLELTEEPGQTIFAKADFTLRPADGILVRGEERQLTPA